MIAVKVLSLLALALAVSASDLDRGLNIMACAKEAIKVGVPDLGVPTHDPYVVIKHNFSWNGDLGAVAAKINFTDMTWAGLATWQLSAEQLSKDSDASAAFNFELYWKKLEINGSWAADESELFLHQHQEGDFSIAILDTTWKGMINVTKPTENSNGTVNQMKVDWAADAVKVHLTGLGVLNHPTEASIATGIKTALNGHLIRNAVGDFLKMRLETVWWNTGKVWQLVDWCNANNVTASY